MAHFARLNANNIVTEVIVVDNKNTATAEGVEEEWIGQAFCVRLFGGSENNWKQTSYNARFRKNYAGIGFTYDPVLDAFIRPQPNPQCILDPETCQWNCPPDNYQSYTWNAATNTWDLVTP